MENLEFLCGQGSIPARFGLPVLICVIPAESHVHAFSAVEPNPKGLGTSFRAAAQKLVFGLTGTSL